MYLNNNVDFNCKSCNRRYDIKVNIPISLSKCDHTICKFCLSNILTKDCLCPYCKERLSDIKSHYKPNKDMLKLLTDINTNNPNPSANQQLVEFWHKEKTKWYYISNNVKATGWVQWNESWFYFQPESGEMMKGWVNTGNQWYYLHSNGEMAEGWIKWENKWYYLEPEIGSMKTGWFEWDDQMYYLNPKDNGRMTIGWLDVDGKKYYLNPDNEGGLTKGHLIINNKHYHFNENGEYVCTIDDDNGNCL